MSYFKIFKTDGNMKVINLDHIREAEVINGLGKEFVARLTLFEDGDYVDSIHFKTVEEVEQYLKEFLGVVNE